MNGRLCTRADQEIWIRIQGKRMFDRVKRRVPDRFPQHGVRGALL